MGTAVDFHSVPQTEASEPLPKCSALFLRHTPPRLYQLETTRSLAARVSILCALVSFLATGYVAFRFRASPQVVQRVFFTTLGLGGFFSATAALLSSLPPHPNDPAQRLALMDQFYKRWPYISDKQMEQEYGSLVDLNQQSRILSEQFAAFKTKLKPFTPFYVNKLDNADLSRLEREIHDGQAFQELCDWNTPKTLEHFPTGEQGNLGAFMGALWIPHISSTFEKQCLKFSQHLSKKGLSADDVFLRYHSLFRAQLQTALDSSDQQTREEKIWDLLRYYEDRVFQELSVEQKRTLLIILRYWVRPIWITNMFRSDASESPLTDSLTESRKRPERIYEILKKTSSFLDFTSDIHVPLLAETALERKFKWSEILSKVPTGSMTNFWEIFSRLCPQTEPSPALIASVKEALAAARPEDQRVLIKMLGDPSPAWRTALLQEIKTLLVPAQSVSGNSFKSASRETQDALEAFLPELEKKALASLRTLKPEDSRYQTALHAFLADSCEASS